MRHCIQSGRKVKLAYRCLALAVGGVSPAISQHQPSLVHRNQIKGQGQISSVIATGSIEQRDAKVKIRKQKFLGSEYIVAPVVMLRENIVIRPIGSLGPEFVSPESLASSSVVRWNGRPIIPIHVGLNQSANTPRFADELTFGYIFDAYYGSGILGSFGYISLERAKIVGHGSMEAVEKIEANERVEVSVGCSVWVSDQAGEAPDGTPYEYTWHGIEEPDHLAVGLEGSEGACSVKGGGCGIPRLSMAVSRANNKGQLKQKPIRRHNTMEPNQDETLFFRTLSSGISDNEIRDMLRMALMALHDTPNLWVDAVFDTTVVYTAYKSGTPEDLLERSYTLDETNHKITLAADYKKVVRVTNYRPVDSSTATVALLSNPKAVTTATSQVQAVSQAGSTSAASTPSTIASRVASYVLGRLRPKNSEASETTEPTGINEKSNAELIRTLSDLLFAVEPGWPEVIDVFADSKTVVYVVRPEGTDLTYQRSYSVSEDGAIALSADRTQVEYKRIYVPIAAEQSQERNINGCGCKGDSTVNTNTKELIDGLIQSGRYAEADRGDLEKISPSLLQKMASSSPVVPADTTSTVNTKAATVEPVDSNGKTVTISAEAYAKILAAADAHESAAAAEKANLVNTLAASQTTVKKEVLEAMTLESLRELSALVSELKPVAKTPHVPKTAPVTAANFGLVPGDVTPAADQGVPKPPSLISKIQAEKSKPN